MSSTITVVQLAAGTGSTLMRASTWLEPISAALDAFRVDTPARIGMFLAQIGHESGRLKYVREIWGPTPAQLRYEGRKDLGNLRPGDGHRYLGRGLIQTTGHANYIAAREGLRQALPPVVPDFEASPELLELPRWAAYSAGWFWAKHGCNELADAGDFEALTRRINGGLNGYEERMALWDAGKSALAPRSTLA